MSADAGYDDWLDAVDAGEAYYLACENGHGALPPRRVCPQCGSPELREEPLPASGTIETYTVVHVSTPEFADQVPYVTAIADFGAVRVTGVVRGTDDVAVGDTDGLGVDGEAGGTRTLTLRPR